MELENKLEAEAIELANKLEVMDKKSEDYGTVLSRYQTIMRMLSEETKRVNSNQELQLEARKLDIESDKIELEGQNNRLNADLKEEELAQQKKSNVWGIIGKVAGAALTVGSNLLMIYTMVKMNNSGETLTSFEQKFIYPDRLPK